MAEQRVSVWILGDQLTRQHPALEKAKQTTSTDNIRVVMVESQQRIRSRRYHKQKIVLVLSAMRHYAAMLREQGYEVDYIKADHMTDGLSQHLETWQPDKLLMMCAAEYQPRQHQQNMAKRFDIEAELLPNMQFLVEQYDPYPDPEPGKRYVMENFYRKMRRHFNVLMTADDEPVGGEWNYDKQNRKPLPQKINLPDMPTFTPDDITQQVIDEVEQAGWGIGSLDGFNYAVTHEQAYTALGHFIQLRLEDFGPYEDAMTTRGTTLFHSVLSPYFNLGLLEPLQAVEAIERAYHDGRAPINSVEGFVRQVIGWREYMYWQYWQLMPELAEMNYWEMQRPMPSMFWDGQTDMNCIKHIVGNALETAYSHHIERLMVVSNFALLAGIAPKAILDWFMSMYIDAYDWVMQPNVIGMGINADGGKIATKPYVASANYINKMSDFCRGCRYKHTKRTGEDACPFNYLYWNFLIEHEDELRANPRSGRNVLGLRHLDQDERQRVQQDAKRFLETLSYDEVEKA